MLLRVGASVGLSLQVAEGAQLRPPLYARQDDRWDETGARLWRPSAGMDREHGLRKLDPHAISSRIETPPALLLLPAESRRLAAGVRTDNLPLGPGYQEDIA